MARVVRGVVDRFGMREADTDDQKGSDQQPQNRSDNGFGTRGLHPLDSLVLH